MLDLRLDAGAAVRCSTRHRPERNSIGQEAVMFVPKSGKIGAMFLVVTILIGAGLLFPPAVLFATSGIALPVPLAGGGEHSLAVASDGTVWRWGLAMDKYNGPWDDMILQPMRIEHIDGVVATAGGDRINLALKSEGRGPSALQN
jgi:hypothetical protein